MRSHITPKTAPEIIADYLGCDWADVKAQRYQPGRTGGISVYAFDDCYLCCPPLGKLPPKGWNWQRIESSILERPVYRAGTEAV